MTGARFIFLLLFAIRYSFALELYIRGSNSGQTKPFHQNKKIEGIDYVITSFDEDARQTLKHLELCVKPNDRVLIYVKHGSLRTHAAPNRKFKRNNKEWATTETPFYKNVTFIDNSICCDEFTGFFQYIVDYYDDLPQNIAFLHGHVDSWHSGKLCDIVDKGIKEIQTSKYGFVNINGGFEWRCVSSNKYYGLATSSSLRDTFYKNWKKWTGSNSVPKRFVWECCAQCIAAGHSLRRRPKIFYETLLETQIKKNDINGHMLEYLWPTIVDEQWSFDHGTC